MTKNMLFDVDDIENLASVQSFERGEEYYNSDSVGKIIKKGNLFEGTVSGTRKYKVSLDYTNGKFDFYCNCPYDFEGIFKHCVAMALAIIDGEYKEAKSANVQVIVQQPIEYFEKSYNSVDSDKKLSFLKQLLDKDKNLQSQFISFIYLKSQKLDNISDVNIDQIRKEIFSKLSDLDFDELLEGDYDYEGYDGGGDELYDQASDLIKAVIDKFSNKAREFIKKGNIIDGMRIILGMYEGSQDLPDLDNDDYNIFDGSYNDTVHDILRDYITELSNEIEQTVKNDETTISAVNLVFSRLNYYKNQYKAGNNEYGEKIGYYPEDLDKIFLALSNNQKTANHLYKLIIDNDLDCLALAHVILKTAELTKNETFWLETSERFAGSDYEVAQKLLDKYKFLKKDDDFARVAKMAFEIWSDKFDLYIVNNLNKKSHKELYISVLSHYTINKQSLDHYNELREYFSAAQIKTFIRKISQGYDKLFYVHVLEREGFYSEILKCVEDNKDAHYFEQLIESIINIYPEECFSIIKEKCQYVVLNSKGRKYYQYMIVWLKIMKNITIKKNESAQYILELHNSRLTALKDELERSGLLK